MAFEPLKVNVMKITEWVFEGGGKGGRSCFWGVEETKQEHFPVLAETQEDPVLFFQ